MLIYVNGKLTDKVKINKKQALELSEKKGLVGVRWAENEEMRCFIAENGKVVMNDYYYDGKDAIKGDKNAKVFVEKKFEENIQA